jgi:hypothetical protein
MAGHLKAREVLSLLPLKIQCREYIAEWRTLSVVQAVPQTASGLQGYQPLVN